jgi:putative DNA primase/helicase
MSAEMKKVIRQYEKDNDLVLQFLEEKCEKAEGTNTKVKSLYDSYKIWCKSNGYFVCSAKRFNADMDAHPEWHSGKVMRDGYPVYKDIKLKGTV